MLLTEQADLYVVEVQAVQLPEQRGQLRLGPLAELTSQVRIPSAIPEG